MWAYENIDANMYIYIYIVIYIYILEPICPLFSLQSKVFSNQNKGHLGSRYTYITQFVEANRSSRKFGAKNPPFSITLAYCVG